MNETGPQPDVEITVVESAGCHFCDDAEQALGELSRTFRFSVRTIDAAGETGRQLMATHRAAMSPLVLMDGAFFSHGRLPRRKLEHALTQRGAERPAG